MRRLRVNTEDKQKLAQKIRSEIQKLSAYTAEGSESSMRAPETDSNVKIEELAIQALDQHTLAEAKRKISALRRTLANINEEGFGFCVNCGTAIALERLLIVPDTDKCPHCAA